MAGSCLRGKKRGDRVCGVTETHLNGRPLPKRWREIKKWEKLERGGTGWYRRANKQVETGKIESWSSEGRDHTGHSTADRPNPLPYCPRLWSSGTGVLSRDSLEPKWLRVMPLTAELWLVSFPFSPSDRLFRSVSVFFNPFPLFLPDRGRPFRSVSVTPHTPSPLLFPSNRGRPFRSVSVFFNPIPLSPLWQGPAI